MGEDVDQGGGQGHHPAPASLRIVMLLQCPEISQLLVEVCDDDGLAAGGQDHLHVRLGLHLSLCIVTSTGRGLGLKHDKYYISHVMFSVLIF